MDDRTSPPAILASDADRKRAIETLQAAVVEGWLTLEEYSDRVGIAVAARTDVDLAALTRDLPATRAMAIPSGAPAEHRAICSHIVRRGRFGLSAQSSFLSVFGTIDLDLRDATLPGSEVELAVRNIFGTVTVIVPEGVDMQIEGGGLFASQYLDASSTTPVPGAPIVRIRASGPGGSLYIKHA